MSHDLLPTLKCFHLVKVTEGEYTNLLTFWVNRTNKVHQIHTKIVIAWVAVVKIRFINRNLNDPKSVWAI